MFNLIYKQRVIFVILLSLIFGYSENIYFNYLNIITDSEYKLLGNLNQYRSECKSKNFTNKNKCRYQYNVPIEELKGFTSLGIGVFTYDLKYYCSSNTIKEIKFVFIDVFNDYQILDLSSLNCTDYLTIESWAPPNVVRYGYQYGPLVASSEVYLYKLKWIAEFFYRDIYRLIFVFLFIISGLYALIKRIDFKGIPDTFFISTCFLWSPYLLIATGLFQGLFPVIGSNRPYLYLMWLFSISAHIYPILLLVRFKRKILLYSIMTLIIALEISLNGSYILYYFYFLAASIFGFYLSAKYKRPDFFLFYFFTLLTLLKTANIDHMPNGRTSTATFLALVIIEIIILYKWTKEQNIKMSNLKDIIRRNELNISNSEYLEMKSMIHDIKSPLSIIGYSLDEIKNPLLNEAYHRINQIIESSIKTNQNKKWDFIDHFNKLLLEKEFIYNLRIIYKYSQKQFRINSFLLKDLIRVLSNIIDNSIEANSDNEMSVTLDFNNKKEIEIVIDNQTEIPYDILKKLNSGESFTTKEYGNGIGASTSFKIITDLNGEIVYHSDGKVKILIPTG